MCFIFKVFPVKHYRQSLGRAARALRERRGAPPVGRWAVCGGRRKVGGIARPARVRPSPAAPRVVPPAAPCSPLVARVRPSASLACRLACVLPCSLAAAPPARRRFARLALRGVRFAARVRPSASLARCLACVLPCSLRGYARARLVCRPVSPCLRAAVLARAMPPTLRRPPQTAHLPTGGAPRRSRRARAARPRDCL